MDETSDYILIGLLVNGSRMKLQALQKNRGFTLVEIMIVVAIVGLLATLAIPNYVRARENAQLNSILNNLRLIEDAKDQWAMANKKGTGDTTDLTSISDYLKGGTINPIVSETYSTEAVGISPAAKVPVSLGTYPIGAVITAR
jgi:prepilin-type N-terminal cleavage/methylation domain-containing protein